MISPKNTWSISLRLMGSATIWIIIPLLISLIFVAQYLSEPVIESVETQVQKDLDELVGAAKFSKIDGIKDGSLFLADKRYAIPSSGLYAQVIEMENPIRVWRSANMKERKPFPVEQIPVGGKPRLLTFGEAILFAASRKIKNPYNGKHYLFSIFSAADNTIATVNEISNRTLLAAFLIIISIIIGVYLQIRFGLKPLLGLRSSINDVRNGDLDRIDTEVAREIKPVAKALNELFKYSDEVLTQARSEAGNLAHSLKTPITVIKNELGRPEKMETDLIAGQLEKIERHVNSYLEHARSSVVFSDKSDTAVLSKTVLSITNALAKVFPDKPLEFSVEIDGSHLFRGSKMHLDDMIGNLLENACKWCEARVKIASKLSRHPVTGNGILSICVEDDGPGIPADERDFVLVRGHRADQKTPGSGIGLDIVRQISSDYGGEVLLSASEWAGLKVTLNIPGESMQRP